MNLITIPEDMAPQLCQLVHTASRSNAVQALETGRKLMSYIQGMEVVVDTIEEQLYEADHAWQERQRMLDDNMDGLHDAKTGR